MNIQHLFCFFSDVGLLLVILYGQILCKLPLGPLETDKPTKPPDTKLFDNIYKQNHSPNH